MILAAGLMTLEAAAQTSEALPFIQMDYNPVSLATGSTLIPSSAVLPLSDVKLAGGVAYESYMPGLSPTNYISAGAAGKFSGFEFAAGASALGGKVQSESTGDFSLPAAITIGGGYTAKFAEVHAITARIKADRYFSGPIAAGFGFEYGYDGLAFARAGYHYGGDSIVPSFASAGLGLKIGEFTLDAAYLFASDILGGTFSVGVGVRF